MSGRTVVVVEDDALLRLDAVAMLDAAGHEVADFETADEAAAYLEEHDGEVTAVLTDIQTPGHLDGFDLALKTAIRWPEVKVLMTSGMPRPTSLLIPSIAFLPKPWLPLDVLTAIQIAAESKAAATTALAGAA